MSQARPTVSMHELLGLLAHELRGQLDKLLPGRPDTADLAVKLTHECSAKIGGHRLPVKPSLGAEDLPGADYSYGVLFDVWAEILSSDAQMPEAGARVVAIHLLHVARDVLGAQYVPKDTSARRRARDEKLWDEFRGSFRDLGLKNGVSSERVRQVIVPRMRAERAARQGRLFDDD